MAEHTGIEWCDATFNPWWGCERVSPACAHCYADTLSKRYAAGKQLWGDGHDFRFFGDKHWAEPLKWARLLPGKLGRRPRVFCASMADVFEPRDELRAPRERLFDLIEQTPELDWLLLTKRPEIALVDVVWRWNGETPPNVWMGTSVENSRYTWRATVLRQIPAAVRFISAEPLLGSLFPSDRQTGVTASGDRSSHQLPSRDGVPLSEPTSSGQGSGPGRSMGSSGAVGRKALDLTDIDWVIVGGESGARARPCDLEHVRELISACKARGYAGAPAVFVKQLGARPVLSHPTDSDLVPLKLQDRKGGVMEEWPCDLWFREFPAIAAVLA